MLDTDQHLLARVSAGDSVALEQLYDRYVNQCFGLAYRILHEATLAERAVQDVFAELWKNASSYSARTSELFNLLLGATHHKCMEELLYRVGSKVVDATAGASNMSGWWTNRAIGDKPGLTAGMVAYSGTPHREPYSLVSAHQEMSSKALGVLERMASEQRELLELAYFDGLTQRQIADRIGQPLGVIQVRISMALQTLSDALN